jgi:hypothetical protein
MCGFVVVFAENTQKCTLVAVAVHRIVFYDKK